MPLAVQNMRTELKARGLEDGYNPYTAIFLRLYYAGKNQKKLDRINEALDFNDFEVKVESWAIRPKYITERFAETDFIFLDLKGENIKEQLQSEGVEAKFYIDTSRNLLTESIRQTPLKPGIYMVIVPIPKGDPKKRYDFRYRITITRKHQLMVDKIVLIAYATEDMAKKSWYTLQYAKSEVPFEYEGIKLIPEY